MPRTMKIEVKHPTHPIYGNRGWSYIDTDVATEDELLAFANFVRDCGGAEPLAALLPSRPGHAKACLIARALNWLNTYT